jgi:methionyl-tRNA formyltransferase
VRAVIFTDIVTATSVDLSLATAAAAKERPDFEVCGFVSRAGEEWAPTSKKLASSFARSALVKAMGGPSPQLWVPSGDRLAKRVGAPVILTDKNVNSAEFIEELHNTFQPDVLLSFFATSIFKPALLDSFAQAVNYHDALLPQYAGLVATEQSIYHNESESGFTFHRITPGIDDGPILVQGSVPIDGDNPRTRVYRAKVQAAAAAIPEVIDMILRNEPGTPQTGERSYYSQADFNALVQVERPQELTIAELLRRLRAFGAIKVQINGATEHVTAIAPSEPDAPFAFPTADGTFVRATRITNLPTAFARIRRRLRR